MRGSPPARHILPAAACALLLGALVTGCGPLFDPGVLQDRAVAPAPRLAQGQSLVQTFTATRDRLFAAEMLVAVYPDTNPASDGDLNLSLREDGVVLGSTTLRVADLRHNGPLRVEVTPQDGSAGKEYTLQVTSSAPEPARATAWLASDDAYVPGSLRLDGSPLPGDITFRAYYDYTMGQLAADLASAAPRGWLLVLALVLLLVPGAGIERLLLARLRFDAAEAVGVWLGLGLSFWAVLFLAATTAGFALGPASIGAVTALFAVALLTATARAAGKLGPRMGWRALGVRLWTPAAGAFLAAGGALVVRFVHARDLALPAWVDSVHHALIVNLIAGSGQVPVDYGPLVPAQPFTYHFGFHLPAVFLVWLGGVEAAEAVLIVGQLLGGLAVFSPYLLASRLVGDRRAGLVAAAIVGLVSTMPAYYVSWGRYPQLAGLVALPAAAVVVGAVLDGTARRRTVPCAVLCLAGVVLVHPRVALILAALLLADVLTRPARRPWSTGWALRGVLLLAGLGAATLLALAPWLMRLSLSPVAAVMTSPGATTGVDPWATILDAGFPRTTDRLLLAGAAAGLVAGLLARKRAAVVGVVWLVLCLVLAEPRRVGLPVSLILGDAALAIALFLPVAVLNGLLASQTLILIRIERWPVVARALVPLPFVVVAAMGAAGLSGIVNPSCVLATDFDVEALRWVATSTPPEARFLINSRRWQGEMVAGTDAGYWLPALAGRGASVPPLPYAHGAPAEVKDIEQLSAKLAGPAGGDAAEVRRLALARGYTHVFVGATGGPLHRETFVDAEGYRLEFTNGRAWVFAVLPD